MITIVDFGLGNLGSIQNMLKRIGMDSVITSEEQVIENATKIILPGVGTFDAGMKGLEERNLLSILNYKALEEKVPILGICLGMQLLTNGSEEGIKIGLGWIEGYTHKFILDDSLKIPHMGWNSVGIKMNNMLTRELQSAKFYFVHSYFVETKDKKDTFLNTKYGVEFASGIHHDNIYGVQFHPEKSHKYGMQLFKNFVEL